MDDPHIFDPESNSNNYDASLDFLAPHFSKQKNYRDSHSPPAAKSSLVNEKNIGHIITRLHQPRPSSLKLITSFPSSGITSPDLSDSDSSSCLSISPSTIPEDCPCKCGSFRGSCLALTLPPSPLHFWIRGTEGEPAQHLFVNDAQHFEDMQRIQLETTMRELNERLARLRDTRSPPRITRPWKESKAPLVGPDMPNESESSPGWQTSDCDSSPSITCSSKISPLSSSERPQQHCGVQEGELYEARVRDPANDLHDKMPLRTNPPPYDSQQTEPTSSLTTSTAPINLPVHPTSCERPSQKSMLLPSSSKWKAQQESLEITRKAKLCAMRPLHHSRPQSPGIKRLGCNGVRGPRCEKDTSPKRPRNSDGDNDDDDEEPQLKKRH